MMKLPLSDMVALSAPRVEEFDVQTVARPSLSTSLPLVWNSKTASLLTGEFLFRLFRQNELLAKKSFSKDWWCGNFHFF